MRSHTYYCRVRHQRFSPVGHAFVYRLFLLALDLDELPQLAQSMRLFSLGSRAVYAFREQDYLPVGAAAAPEPTRHPGVRLKQRVQTLMSQHGWPTAAAERVTLLTLPRILGYAFNPVSFYFCSDAAGRPSAAVAEVNNTFGEAKPFLLRRTGGVGDDAVFICQVPKEFYVSPFSAVSDVFEFRLRSPGGRLALQIDIYRGTQRTLTAHLVGRRRPLDDRQLARAFLTHPLLTLKVTGGIHLQALRLLLKKTPWLRKAHDRHLQRGVYRPHPSLQ